MSLLRTIALLFFLGLSLGTSAEERLVIYNWTEYLPTDAIEAFTAETGIQVQLSTYESNEVMYAKLKLQQGKGYDLVVPSTYFLSKMAAEGLLQPIDHSKLSNFHNLDPLLLDKPYDPGNRFSVPYLWGSTGIGVNSAAIDPASIHGWADLWDAKWRGKLLLTDDMREVFQMALRINGQSANSRDPEVIRQAFLKLKELMPNVLAFNSDAPREPFLAGDVDLGMIWSGEMVMARKVNDKLQYIFPKEGAAFWVDSFVIPAGAEHVDNALRFIDFMLRPEMAKKTVEAIGYATPNKAALPLLEPAVRDNPIIFAPAEELARGEFQLDVGEAAIKIYNDYWQQLKAGR